MAVASTPWLLPMTSPWACVLAWERLGGALRRAHAQALCCSAELPGKAGIGGQQTLLEHSVQGSIPAA